MTDDYAAEARADEDFAAVLDHLSLTRLDELARATVPFMNRKEIFSHVYMAVSGMDSKEQLELVMEHTPGQYAICVRDSGVNEDLRLAGIPPSGA
jgi:hypothetical protein